MAFKIPKGIKDSRPARWLLRLYAWWYKRRVMRWAEKCWRRWQAGETLTEDERTMALWFEGNILSQMLKNWKP